MLLVLLLGLMLSGVEILFTSLLSLFLYDFSINSTFDRSMDQFFEFFFVLIRKKDLKIDWATRTKTSFANDT